MPSFGPASQVQLATLHHRLQEVLVDAVKYYDFSIVEGYRGEVAQNAAFAKGLSKLPWPKGNHNNNPSTAADCAPFPIDWSDRPDSIRRFCYMAGFILASARRLGIKVRWGGDWNQNDDLRDEGSFRDWPHFELVEPNAGN